MDGTNNRMRMTMPSALEKWADQPWIAYPQVGGTVAPAQTFRNTRTNRTLRNQGKRGEKFTESHTRVNETSGHPGVYNLLGDREMEEEALMEMIRMQQQQQVGGATRGGGGATVGILPPENTHLLTDGPLGAAWPTLKMQQEYYRAGYECPRGPSLQVLHVDPGPLYAITSSSPASSSAATRRQQQQEQQQGRSLIDHTLGGIGSGASGSGGVLTTLLAVPKAVSELAGSKNYNYNNNNNDEDANYNTTASNNNNNTMTRNHEQYHVFGLTSRGPVNGGGGNLESTLSFLGATTTSMTPSSTAVGAASIPLVAGIVPGTQYVYPAGSFMKGTQDTSMSMSTVGGFANGMTESRYDLSKSVGQQFYSHNKNNHNNNNATAINGVDITSIGPNNVIVTGRSAAHNAGLLGYTRPSHQNPNTLVAEGASGAFVGEASTGGRVREEGEGYMPTIPIIQTVVHPLDAFPATRRLVAEEKAGQIEAEKYRKAILSAAIRKDMLAAKHHPNGALGVDSLHNTSSGVYGEAAMTRERKKERALNAAAMREARILGQQVSAARRGYDILRPHDTAVGVTSSRLPAEALERPAYSREAARDGVKFLEHKTHSLDPLGLRHATHNNNSTTSGGGVLLTARVLLGESLPQVQPQRTQNLINLQSNGRTFDIVSGTNRPTPIMPDMPERKGYWRHAHPSISSVFNPLQR